MHWERGSPEQKADPSHLWQEVSGCFHTLQIRHGISKMDQSCTSMTLDVVIWLVNCLSSYGSIRSV